jgi:hypothetical protein
MIERPRSILLISAYLVFLCVFFAYLGQLLGMFPLYFWAAIQLLCAVGLYYMCEWARNFVVGTAVMNIINIIALVIMGYFDPGLDVLLLIGMELYIVTVLTNKQVRGLFS